MMKLPGIASAGSGLIGEIGSTATTGIRGLQGGAGGAQAKQENSDLSKVVEDLLHDKLMGKMGGAGGASSPFGAQQAPTLGGLQMPKLGGGAMPNSFGGLQLPRGEGGHGPVVHGGAQAQGAQQENGDLKKLLSDLLQQRSGGAQGGQPQALGGQGGENGDLMKLLEDLLKGRNGGAQGAASNPFGAQQLGGQQPAAGSLIQPQSGGVGGENEDLMKLIEDLLKGQMSASGAGGSSGSGNPMHLLAQEGDQLKDMQAMMQKTA